MDATARLAALRAVTWEEIEDWAGASVARRGRTYANGGRVHGLASAPDGDLVAWVHGTTRYATLVAISDEGLTSVCSCPYYAACKHAVALLLTYQTTLATRRAVPSVPATDPRLALLTDEEEALVDEDDPSGEPAADSARAYLDGLSREELVSLLGDLAGRSAEVRDALEARRRLASGDVGRIVREVRSLIHDVSARSGWHDDWEDDGDTPDYGGVRDRLALLLRQGHTDRVIELGDEILETGNRAVEESHDEGELASEIADCMTVAFQALAQSTLPPVDQVVRAIEWETGDEFDLCSGAAAFWEATRASAADWSAVADILMARLDQRPVNPSRVLTSDYRRDQVAERAIQALERAGRQAEIVPLCEREAVRAGRYVRLVERLVAAGRTAEAEYWIGQGLVALGTAVPGLTGRLRDIQRTLWEQADDWARVAASWAETFFTHPAIHTFRQLRAAARRADRWPPVRSAVLHFLATGETPAATERMGADGPIPAWPLPATGLPPEPPRWPPTFPLVELLIEIAMDEQQPDEVLRWYDQLPANAPHSTLHTLVADAVAETHPARAVAIWRQLAEARIAETNVAAYDIAAGFLRKMGRVMKRHDEADAWRTYIAELRLTNKRKRRLVEVLDQVATSI